MGSGVACERTLIFKPGDRIVVRTSEPSHHVRTPGYVKGKRGVVLAYRGTWPNPELLAYRMEDPSGVALFTVQFSLESLWKDYVGNADDCVTVDLYEHWLEAEAVS